MLFNSVFTKSDVRWKFPLLNVAQGLQRYGILLDMAACAISGSELDDRELLFLCGICFGRGSHVKWIRHMVMKGTDNYCVDFLSRCASD